MRITAIKQYHWDRYHFVKVETDEDIFGFGETTRRGKQSAIHAAVEFLTPKLIGQDVLDLERTMDRFFGCDSRRGGVIYCTAMAAIEMAVLDAIGKKRNEPVCNLLGGRVRDSVKLYAHGCLRVGVSEEELRCEVKKYKDMGFTCFKGEPILFTKDVRNFVTREQIDKAIDTVYLWREIVGDDVDICVDFHGNLNYDQVMRFIKGAEGMRLFFIEEPLGGDDDAGYIKLSKNTDVAIAAGERLFTRWGHRHILKNRVVKIVQPDYIHCCGLWEAKKMAANAELYGALVAPHSSDFSVSTLASIQVDATLPNFYQQEISVSLLEKEKAVNLTPIKLRNGEVHIDDLAPGIGFTPDFSVLSE